MTARGKKEAGPLPSYTKALQSMTAAPKTKPTDASKDKKDPTLSYRVYLCVAFLVVILASGISYAARFQRGGQIAYLEDSASVRPVLISGQPWVLLCKDSKNAVTKEGLLNPEFEAAHALLGRSETLKRWSFGVMNCQEKLSSTTSNAYQRYKLNALKPPVAFLAIGGQKTQVPSDALLPSSADSHVPGRNLARFVKKTWLQRVEPFKITSLSHVLTLCEHKCVIWTIIDALDQARAGGEQFLAWRAGILDVDRSDVVLAGDSELPLERNRVYLIWRSKEDPRTRFVRVLSDPKSVKRSLEAAETDPSYASSKALRVTETKSSQKWIRFQTRNVKSASAAAAPPRGKKPPPQKTRPPMPSQDKEVPNPQAEARRTSDVEFVADEDSSQELEAEEPWRSEDDDEDGQDLDE